MQHIAIDLGGKESQICIRDKDGRIVEECRRETATLCRYPKRREKSRVMLETCSEATALVFLEPGEPRANCLGTSARTAGAQRNARA